MENVQKPVVAQPPAINPRALSPLHWDGARLLLLDQRALPNDELWLACDDYRQVAEAITDMVVRGAPAIGCAAAWGVALGALKNAPLAEVYALLAATRPTAVNLFWALDRMKRVQPQNPEALLAEAARIQKEDIASCRAIGKNGAPLLPAGVVLTHCNAGALATGGFGTALGVIRAAVSSGKKVRVLAGETRPFLQGARLTAWELQKSGIDVTVITDGMAAYLMAKGEIQSVVVGADRIAANGDVANKIGTYAIALAARHHKLPFFVAAPLSSVDLTAPDGDAIVIEERPEREVTHIGERRLVPAGVRVRNPSFDVTPAALITALITEVGVARAPYDAALRQLFETARVAAARARADREYEDRRTAPRVPVELRVVYMRDEDLQRDFITNLSTGGLFIRTSRPLPIGSELDLEVSVGDDSPIRVRGRVTWLAIPRAVGKDDDGGREEGMGLAFIGEVDDRLTAITTLKPLVAEND